MVPPVRGMELELDEIAAEQSQETTQAGVELAAAAGLAAEPLTEKWPMGRCGRRCSTPPTNTGPPPS